MKWLIRKVVQMTLNHPGRAMLLAWIGNIMLYIVAIVLVTLLVKWVW